MSGASVAAERSRSAIEARHDRGFDLSALVLLGAALAAPWQVSGGITGRPDLVAAIACAALGIILPALIPAVIAVDRRGRTALAGFRTLTALPLFIGVASAYFAPRQQSNALGAGAAFATCAAFMVIAPRADAAADSRIDPVLRGLAAAAFLAAGGVALIDVVSLVSSAWESPILWAAATPGLGIAISAWWLAALVLTRDARGPAAIAFFALAAPVAAPLLELLDRLGAVVEPADSLLSFDTSDMALFAAIGVGSILLHAPAAHAADARASRLQAERVGPVDPTGPMTQASDDAAAASRWIAAAAALQVLVTIGAVAEGVRVLILLTWNSVGMIVGTAVLAWALTGSALCVALSLSARALLQRSPVAGRLFTLLAGTVMVAAFGVGALAHLVTIGHGQALTLVVFPLFSIACLVVPGTVRRTFGPVVPRDGWRGLGLTHEPQYDGAPRGPMTVPVTLNAEQLFGDLEFGPGRP